MGLRPHLNRFSHVTVNVSDLERAREFWEATFPVRAVARTGGTTQAFRTLGLEAGRFDGYMLKDATAYPEAYPSRAIHLVQWKRPAPVGAPYELVNSVGWFRLCAVSLDVPARYERVLAAGGRPYAEPRTPGPGRYGASTDRVSFAFRDPDGITLEWITTNPRLGPPGPDRTYHVNANCRDLRESFRFYRDVVGLDLVHRTQPSQPAPLREMPGYGTFPPGWDGLVDLDAVFLGHRADVRSPIDLLQWLSPEPVGVPYASPLNLGIVRLALEVDDVDAAYESLLRASGVPPGAVAGPPEPWDYGELGVRKTFVIHDPDGLALEVVERPPYSWETDPARATYSPLPGV